MSAAERSDPQIENGEQEEPEPEEGRKKRRAATNVGDKEKKGVKAFSPHVAGTVSSCQETW